MTDDFFFATLDLDDESPENTARVNGWLDAVTRGFHQGHATDEFREKWLAAVRADGATSRGVWESPELPLSTQVPVATFGHFVKTLNTGAAHLPARMITDVTVAPTHRRRGLMRRLMTENLEDAASAGLPVAVLTASEGAIYQRFGFGLATREAQVRVDSTSRFRLRQVPDDGGRVAMVDASVAWPTLSAVFEKHHLVTRGSLGRPTHYQAWLKGYDWEAQSEDRRQRIAVRFGPDGEADGFVAYAQKRTDGTGEIEVRDMVTSSPAAHLALWQFLADIDLADVVTVSAPVVDPLTQALVDHRVRRVTAMPDHLWVRILDVPAALEARPWFGTDRIVLRVVDGLGHADGTFSIDASDGRAAVTPTSHAPDVTLDVETLGTLYLGDVTVDPLAKGGRITATDDALHRFATLADGSPSPHCSAHF